MSEQSVIDRPDAEPATGAYHYRVMARAIAAIDAAGGAPLPLERLSAEVGLSPAHLQKTFSRWAGISPKRLQQYLALGHAKALLAAGAPVMETAHAVGLSGPSRLHDLFGAWEATTPGEWAKGDRTLRWAWTDSPFGEALVVLGAKGIAGLAFAEPDRAAAWEDLAGRWPEARLVEDAEAARVGAAAFGGARMPLAPMGGPFQIKVWEALMRVPTGTVTTYGALAEAIGNPRAVRAVGTAVGRNPVSWLIPCHRAIRATGALGGYHWGLPRKRAMLAHEAAQRAGAGPRASH